MPKTISRVRNQYEPDFGLIPTAKLHARLKEFQSALNKAAEGRKTLSENPSLTRKRLLATLKVISEFVGDLTSEPLENDISIGSHAASLIERLVIAIEELSYGIVDPVLERGQSCNRTILPTAQKKRQQSIAADYKILRRKGFNPNECYRKLAAIYGLDQKKIRSQIKNYPSKIRRIKSTG